jgi:hypothetical protein
MQLRILGRNTDDKGTQLEILTTELLEALGYDQIRTNVASDAGEVDVEAVLIHASAGSKPRDQGDR